MDHITSASKNLTDAQCKTTRDPLTWTGPSFINKPAGGSIIQGRLLHQK